MGLFPQKKYGINCVFSLRLTNKSLFHNHHFHRKVLLMYFSILNHILSFTLATALHRNTEAGKSIPWLIFPVFSSIPFLCDCLTEKNRKGPTSLKFGAIKGLLSCFSDAGTQTSGCVKTPTALCTKHISPICWKDATTTITILVQPFGESKCQYL